MGDGEVRFVLVSSDRGEVTWHVARDGRFPGTMVQVAGGFQATLLALAGKPRTQLFAERAAAARWLSTLAPAQRSAGRRTP